MKKSYLFSAIITLLLVGCNDNVLDELPDAAKAVSVQTGSISSSCIDNYKDVNFGLSVEYDSGVDPAIAINANKNVLEVHRSSISSNLLWYHTGVTDQMNVNWNGSVSYDIGCDPSIALNDDNVAVEIHRSPIQSTSGSWVKYGWIWLYKFDTYYKTWYHVGQLNKGNVSWGGSVNYGSGEEPDVAMNNAKLCVEVHRSGANLYSRVGIVNVNNKTINFGDNSQFASGYAPEVALNNKNEVIAMYHDASSNLYYQVGIINSGSKTISWGTAKLYGKGNRGDIALADKGDVIETHVLSGEIYKIAGLLNSASKSVVWRKSALFDKGTYFYEFGSLDTPGVAIDCNGSMAIQTHSSKKFLPSNDRSLQYSTSLFIDRLKWMEGESQYLSGKHLYEICMPGSHDAGIFNINASSKRIAFSNCQPEQMSTFPASFVVPFAKTQDLSIIDQLKVGVRFFDLRPHYDNNRVAGDSSAFYAYHGGLLGGSFITMLDDLRTFMNSTHGEVVVLRLGWFSNFDKLLFVQNEVSTDKNHKALVKLIQSYLGDYLYKNSTGAKSYCNLTYDEVVNSGNVSSKVIVLYDGQNDLFYKDNGFFSFNGEYDNYSNTTNYEQMRADQLSKLKSNYSKPGNLFLLNWALTVNKDENEIKETLANMLVTQDLEGLSNTCNMNLRSFSATYGKYYKMGVLFTDYVEKSASTDCAIMQNRLK